MAKNTYDKDYLNQLFSQIQEDIRVLFNKNEQNKTTYVTLDRFLPLEKLLYGIVGLMLTAVVLALLGLVLKQ